MRRARIALAAIASFAIWPLVHGAITRSRASGFTPWKLMGFGMFAEPHVYRNHIAVFVLPEGTPPQPNPQGVLSFWKDLGPRREPFEVAVATTSGWATLDVSKNGTFGGRPAGASLGASSPGADYRARITDAQCFYNSPRAIGALAEAAIASSQVAGPARQGPESARAVIVVSKPHLAMERGVHFAETCVFQYRSGDVRQLGCTGEPSGVDRFVARAFE